MAMNPFMGMGDPSRRIGGPAPVRGYERPTQPSPWFGRGQPKPPTISGQETPWSPKPERELPRRTNVLLPLRPKTDPEQLEREYIKQMQEYQSKTAPYAQEFQSRYGAPATEEFLSAYMDKPISPIELSMTPYQRRRFEEYGFDPYNWKHTQYQKQMSRKPRMFSL